MPNGDVLTCSEPWMTVVCLTQIQKHFTVSSTQSCYKSFCHSGFKCQHLLSAYILALGFLYTVYSLSGQQMRGRYSVISILQKNNKLTEVLRIRYHIGTIIAIFSYSRLNHYWEVNILEIYPRKFFPNFLNKLHYKL